MIKIIGIGEYAISNDKEDIIKTYALGSCVAIVVYSPINNVAGMVHIALPSSDHVMDDSLSQSCYYATSAVPFLLDQLCKEFGCRKHELRIELFGGAKSIRDNDFFMIGQRNINMIKKILDNLNLNYIAQDIGGSISRTIDLCVATGKVNIVTQPITI